MAETIVCPPGLAEMFMQFINDKPGNRMLLDGMAGCGKSSQTAQNLMPLFFQQYPDARVRYLAPTHAAKNELRDKLAQWSELLQYHFEPEYVMTTHRYTGMVPTTDDGAIQANLVRRIRQIGEALECDLLVVDEAPMIDPEVGAQLNYLLESGLVKRAMFMGDQNQLKPVNGAPVIVPGKNEKYHYLIKDTYRAAGEDIRNHVRELYRKIDTGNGDGLRYTIPASDNVRYGNLPSTLRTNARVLAYTHKAVQAVNAQLRGREYAEEGDITYSRTTKTHYRVEKIIEAENYFFMENIRTLERVRQNPGEDPPHFDRLLNERSDRFRTRSHCASLPGVQLMVLQPVVSTPTGWESEDEPEAWFVLYGSSRHNQATKQAQKEGIRHNQDLCEKYGVPDDELTDWCTERWDWDEVKAKKKAWRTFFALDRTILCLDAPFCITVHQSQGMTIPRTYVALDDIKLAKVTDQGGDTFARLLYVALSRASREIVILQDDLI